MDTNDLAIAITALVVAATIFAFVINRARSMQLAGLADATTTRRLGAAIAGRPGSRDSHPATSNFEQPRDEVQANIGQP